MGSFIVLLVVIAGVALWFGFTQLTEATLGVGVIGLVCANLIVTRMIQAEVHHRRQLKALGVKNS